MRNYSRLVLGVAKVSAFALMLFVASAITSVYTNTTPTYAAACGSEPSSTTGRVSQSITVPANDTYRIWSRMKAPSTSDVEYKVYVSGQCFTIGQDGLPANTLTWVDYENGSTSDKADITLTAGTHTLVFTAGTEDLELDRVMLLSDTGCTPVGTGDNCNNDTTLPNTSITSPTAGATVSGTTAITATATDNDAIDRVEFYRGATLIGTDSTGPSPYTVNWDTTAVADGSYSLTARAYDISDNLRTSTAVSVTVDNTPPVNADIASFSASPTTITAGGSSTLSWTVNAGTGCSINNGVGSVGLTGNQSVSPTTTTTYTLSCNGQNGGTGDTAQATVTVNPAPVNANITSFTASPNTITSGQTSTLSWSVSVGTNCSIDQSIGAVGTSGTEPVNPTTTTTYTLSCDGLNGGTGDTAQATVTVNASPVNADITSFSAAPTTIVVGQSSTLSWNVAVGQNCSIDNGVGSVGGLGNQSVSPTSTTTYTLTCSGLNGGTGDSAQATITVNPAPVNADIASFTAAPTTIINGQSSTLSWTVNAGQNCSINQGVGSVGLSGNQSVSPTSTTTYTLTCSGLNGGSGDTAQATVTVNPAPINADITSFTATPSSITSGQSSTLAWSVSAGTGCSINQSVGSVGLSGNQSVSPTSTTTYTLTCSGQYGGSGDSAQATVTVVPPTDTDSDGIPDGIEQSGPNGGDANFDGTPDYQQANVVSLINAKNNLYNTIVASGSCDAFSNAQSVNGGGEHSLFGAWSFELACDNPGDSGQVEVFLDKQYDASSWEAAKFDSGLTQPQDITSQVTFASTTHGGSVFTSFRYTLTDGGDLDEDGAADGTATDPVAVLAATSDGSLSNTGVDVRTFIIIGGAIILLAGATIGYYVNNQSRIHGVWRG